MAIYRINRDSLGDTSDQGAEQYRADVLKKLNENSNGKIDSVEWGDSNPSGVWFRHLETVAQQVWDDNIADYGVPFDDADNMLARRKTSRARYAQATKAVDGLEIDIDRNRRALDRLKGRLEYWRNNRDAASRALRNVAREIRAAKND